MNENPTGRAARMFAGQHHLALTILSSIADKQTGRENWMADGRAGLAKTPVVVIHTESPDRVSMPQSVRSAHHV